MKRTYQRGEMYYADLGHGVGSEQEGRRPVVIIHLRSEREKYL